MEARDDEAATVQVKFAGRTISVRISCDQTVGELKQLLQPVTNVLPRGQKLIFKGRVLVDASSLRSQQVCSGSKVMLVASQGLHQGEGPLTKDTTASSTNTRSMRTICGRPQSSNFFIEKSRPERWKSTGVVALSECQLKSVPEEVWSCGTSIRVLDISSNFVQGISMGISSLVSLKKLILNNNDLEHGGICWEGLSSLKFLQVLSLNHNQLTMLPSAVGTLTSLCQLHVAHNRLNSLPAELGALSQLEILKADNNRIVLLPSSIGDCGCLVEVDLSHNLLAQLPDTFGHLTNLKALRLRNNGLKSLPTSLFKVCSQLSTLDLHGTEITNDSLRQVEGWEDFDERRRLKHQKQLDFRAGSSGVFYEGADDNRGP